jgi:heptaprenyl diphosphate synthase
MIRSAIELPAGPEDHTVARLAALATLAWMAEALLPSPLPGLKPGVANIVVLYARFRLGLGAALWVSALRVIGGSLLLGTFMSPGFALAVAGTLGSALGLVLAAALPGRWFGPPSHSVLAALGHVAGQLGLAAWWLIPVSGLVWIVPVLAGGAVLFGAVNGVVVAHLLASPGETPPAVSR